MFKNTQVVPTKSKHATAEGHTGTKANMPAKNSGTHAVVLGSGKNSTFGANVTQKAAQKGVNQTKTGGKVNMPANNVTNNGPAMGTTKHAVGTVPSYLQAK